MYCLSTYIGTTLKALIAVHLLRTKFDVNNMKRENSFPWHSNPIRAISNASLENKMYLLATNVYLNLRAGFTYDKKFSIDEPFKPDSFI